MSEDKSFVPHVEKIIDECQSLLQSIKNRKESISSDSTSYAILSNFESDIREFYNWLRNMNIDEDFGNQYLNIDGYREDDIQQMDMFGGFNLKRYKRAQEEEPSSRKEIWLEGNQAAKKGGTQKDNPYDRDDPRWFIWNEGFWKGMLSFKSSYAQSAFPSIPGSRVLVDDSPESLVRAINDLFQSHGDVLEKKGISKSILQSVDTNNTKDLKRLFGELSSIIRDFQEQGY